jgi:hypothetical protein
MPKFGDARGMRPASWSPLSKMPGAMAGGRCCACRAGAVRFRLWRSPVFMSILATGPYFSNNRTTSCEGAAQGGSRPGPLPRRASPWLWSPMMSDDVNCFTTSERTLSVASYSKLPQNTCVAIALPTSGLSGWAGVPQKQAQTSQILTGLAVSPMAAARGLRRGQRPVAPKQLQNSVELFLLTRGMLNDHGCKSDACVHNRPITT